MRGIPRPCTVCGTLTPGASRCPAHQPRHTPNPHDLRTGAAWRHARTQALTRDHHACTQCGATTGLQVHHLREVRDGGTNTLENLVTLCGECHLKAHNRKPARWRHH